MHVPDLEKSADFYRKFFGKETSRERSPERIWFTAARTRLGLEKVAAGQAPHVDRFGIRVAAFNRQAVTRKLDAAGVMVLPSTGENLLRFRDADGFTVELRGVLRTGPLAGRIPVYHPRLWRGNDCAAALRWRDWV